MTVLFENIDGPYPRATLLLRLPPPSIALIPEVRCAVVGNVDSGKSTTLGVLTRGMLHPRLFSWGMKSFNCSLGPLDDGRGRARVALFRHKHEIETGRTSSVGMEVSCEPHPSYYQTYYRSDFRILDCWDSGSPQHVTYWCRHGSTR